MLSPMELEESFRPLVLVVDDDPGVREMVSSCLNLEGYKTLRASNAQEAISHAQNNPPQAVVLDLMLPGEDGFAVCRRLRENSRTDRCIILLLSALDKVDSRVRGLKAGADDFLVKPFDPAELAARLNAHLRRMKVQEEKERMLEEMAESLRRMNRRLEEEVFTDSLTGLYNRRYFWKRLEEEYQRSSRFRHPLSLVLLDLDRFKSVNDEYGHVTGDLVLKSAAKILKEGLRGMDLACRVGGEEFAVVLPETPFESALGVAERLLAACRETVVSPLLRGRLSFSAGVACFPVHANIPQALYEKADEALYRAKAEGRDRAAAANSP